jgi:hypothetical protein
MNAALLFLVILVALFVLGALPPWGLHGMGWAPSGIGVVLLVILLVVLVREGL